MLHVHRAERADALVDGLAEVLVVSPADVMAQDIVAVPTRGMERWLSQRLSHHLGDAKRSGDGVCANLVFPNPSALIQQAVLSIAGDAAGWTPEHLRWALLAELDRAEANAALAPVRRYLAAGLPGAERRLQVAGAMAEAFERYAADRPGMLVAWVAGDDSDGAGSPLPEDLRWQAELYRRVRDHIATPGPGERLDEVCAAIGAEPAELDLPQRLSVFGPTRLTASELRVLQALSLGREVHLWFPHPSPALWTQDLTGGDAGRRPRRRRHDTSGGAVRIPLLAGLGRDSRELQLRLADVTVPRADTHHPLGTRPRTLLGRLQQTLADDAWPAGPVGAADGSVAVHACHGPARQVEVLREVVVGLLADDPTLEPRDIVVMVPHVERYAPLVSATFGLLDAAAEGDGRHGARHPGQRIRVMLADRSLRQTNPVLAVVADLLDLVDARLTASQVIDLASAEPVRRRFDLDTDDLDRIRTWVAESGVRWGLDAEHRQRAGLPEVTQNTWSTGLDRILLGVSLSEEGSPLVGGVLPVDDVGSQDIDRVGRLAELVDRLADITQSLRATKEPDAWVQALDTALDLLVDTAPADAWQVLSARREISALLEAANPGVELALGDVRTAAEAAWAGRPSRASFRTGDLTVCSLVPMRAVPHRVVCVLGLDDGAFPRTGRADGDDVLARDPLVGERDVRSEDHHILLDAIHSATEKLVLVYSGADPRTNAVLPPCVPLGEVLDALATLTGDPATEGREAARERLVVRHPLQAFDARNFVAGALGGDRPFSFDAHALAGARRTLAERRRPPRIADLVLPATTEETVSLADLVSFLESPARGLLRQRFGISVGGRDVDEVDDMLTADLDPLQGWAVADRLLRARLRGDSREEAARAERARGLLPPGTLGDTLLAEKAALADRLAADVAARGLPDPRVVDVLVPLGAVSLVGSVSNVRGSTVARVVASRLGAKHRLRSWVQLLALTTAEPGTEWRSVVIGKGSGDELATSTLGPLAPQHARAVLGDLVALRALGLRRALPLAPKTSEAYVRHRRQGDPPHRGLSAARARWDRPFNGHTESMDEDAVLVWGPDATIETLTAVEVPEIDVDGEGHAFGALARRVWDPLLDAEEAARD